MEQACRSSGRQNVTSGGGGLYCGQSKRNEEGKIITAVNTQESISQVTHQTGKESSTQHSCLFGQKDSRNGLRLALRALGLQTMALGHLEAAKHLSYAMLQAGVCNWLP